ncbi:MAG: ribosome maturation factor RimM [Sporolactobacillus sp.]
MAVWHYVGKIVNTRGIKGEVKVISETDFPEERFAAGSVLYVNDEKTGSYDPLTVSGYRYHKPFVCLTFEHHLSIDAVEKFKGSGLFIPREQLSELGKGEFYYHEIIGSQVLTEEGRLLGTVKEILSPGANDVWVIQTDGNDLLLPYIDDVVKSVDVAKKQIRVHLIPGLVDDEN